MFALGPIWLDAMPELPRIRGVERWRVDSSRSLAILIAGVVAVALMVVITAVIAIGVLSTTRGARLDHARELVAVRAIESEAAHITSAVKGYLITGAEMDLKSLAIAHAAFDTRLAAIGGHADPALFAELRAAALEYRGTVRAVVTRARHGDRAGGQALLLHPGRPQREVLRARISELRTSKQRELADATRSAEQRSRTALFGVIAVGFLALALAAVLGVMLRRLVKKLEVANRDLEAFAGRVAHDLRGAFTPIRLASQVMATAGADVATRAGPVIERGVNRASRMLDGLLEFSTAAGKTEAVASVVEAVDDVLDEAHPALEAAHIHCERHVQPGLVRCHPGLLLSIVGNLVHNAIKFIQRSDVRTVMLRGHCDADGYQLEIADTGPGIPESELGHIFEPFYRVSGTCEPGTGIGLATVHRIVRAHGGTIQVTSKEGAGTSFLIRLPTAPV